MHKRKVIPMVISGLLMSTASVANTHQIDCIKASYTALPGQQKLYASAYSGDALAQTQLARMYHLGLGMDSNPEKAVVWYRKAASQGNAEAQFNLGIMYLDGIGVTENATEALRWIARAAKQKHSGATEVYNYILNNDGPLEC